MSSKSIQSAQVSQDALKALIAPVQKFLLCPSPKAWLESAAQQQACLLIDHAHCEKKAASTALNMIYRYPHKPELLTMLSQLAREELLHFDQVLELIKKRGYVYGYLSASAYASKLHALADNKEPARLIDTLIMGAIIEARSCERFYALMDYVDEELSQYYRYLLKSESRHFEDYLTLARLYAPDILGSLENLDARIQFFLEKEKELIEAEDSVFRFHSGIPNINSGVPNSS